jgi:UDP-galactopyranose mutase
MYDFIIIGSGFAGAVVANKMAKEGKKVLIIEKRNHIGGNCYDTLDEHGVLIHQYGPHIFHTNNEEVYEYLSQFTKWYDYSHEVVANLNGMYIPVPFNLNTLKKVYDAKKADELEEKLIREYGFGTRVPILKLRENKDEDIRAIADFVYENIFLKYTMKQWGQTPEQVDPAVTARVPVLISNDNRYFQDKYQGMPLDGFTPMFDKMLDNPNITIMLSQDAKDILEFRNDGIYYENQRFNGQIIYTGALDELFDCKYGRLPYRTLKFDFSFLKQDEYQPRAVVNYTVSEDFTRITEFKKLTGQQVNGTTIMKEYPMAYTGAKDETPYYAIMNESNKAIYEKYVNLVSEYKNFHLLGRLAEYKYYNIDGIVEKALNLVKEFVK